MKNNIIRYMALSVLAPMCFACKKQNVPESKDLQPPAVGSSGYYANLRAYKQSDHELAFGWFGGTGGDGNISFMEKRWLGLPDSMDIISCWGGFPVRGSEQEKEMVYCQKEKGMKVVGVTFVGDGLMYSYPHTPAGFDSATRPLTDTIAKYGVDGWDFDNEPSGFLADADSFAVYLQALSKYLGPASGTGKLLIVDGYAPSANTFPLIDYFASQAYYTSSPSSLDYRLPDGLPPEKIIVNEDFEAGWSTGGVSYSDPIHGTLPSLWGMAYWEPSTGRKGGCGSYHMEYDYQNSPDYKYMRQAIQIMNPAAR